MTDLMASVTFGLAAIPRVPSRRLSRAPAGAALLAVLALLTAPAPGLINPNFTPLHMVEQSETILLLEVGPLGANDELPIRIVKAVKGGGDQKAMTVSLSKTDKPQAKAFRTAMSDPKAQAAMLFVGSYKEEGAEDYEAGPEKLYSEKALGLLHVAGQWFRLAAVEAGAWRVDILDVHLQGTWAGSTEMLRRAVDYILTDPDPDVPVKTDESWGEPAKVAALSGNVHALQAVDLAGDGRLTLFAAGDAGDRTFRYDAAKNAYEEVTQKLKLSTKSKLVAWGDFNADGRLDLVSYDGKALTLLAQEADGTFQPAGKTTEVKEPFIGLAALDIGGKASLLASTAGAPVLLAPNDDGTFETRPAVTGGADFSVSGMGKASACLVADLDGDNVRDVLQPFAKGALFYKGDKGGLFRTPSPCPGLGTGDGRAAAYLGDYDADGLLDVFLTAEESCLIWHNLGGGQFRECLNTSGETAYISKPKGVGGLTCDINNDGRQDLFILYADRAPQLFFNRGFLSFGHSHSLDLDENGLLAAAGEGQQAGVVADLTGSGAQCMALVLSNGELWVFTQASRGGSALCVRAALPAGGFAGPLTVTGAAGKRPLGAWNVLPGAAEAFFGRREAGACTLRWQLPGAGPQEKKVILEDKPVRAVLTGAGAEVK